MPCLYLGTLYSCEDLHKFNKQPFGLVMLKRIEMAQIDPLWPSHFKWSLIPPFWNPFGWSWWWQIHWLWPCKILNQIFHNVECFFQCGTIPMINGELRSYHPLHLFVLLGHVQLHQLPFRENVTTFLGKLCKPHAHGAWNIIFFPLEILDLPHLILANASTLQFQNPNLTNFHWSPMFHVPNVDIGV
jgi:hypothetical protein